MSVITPLHLNNTLPLALGRTTGESPDGRNHKLSAKGILMRDKVRTVETTLKVTQPSKGNFRHSCGGQMAVEGTVTQDLPLGFGFVGGDTRFRMDALRRKGYYGFCLKCNAKGNWYIGNGRHITKHPKSINNKLAAARATL